MISKNSLLLSSPTPFSAGIGLIFLFFLSSLFFLLADDETPENPNALRFQNTPPPVLVDLYEKLSGKEMIRDFTLSAAPPITLNATGLNKEELLNAIETSLLVNGVSMTRINDHTIKVLVNNQHNPKSEGIPLILTPQDLPVSDQIVAYYLPLSYISPTEAVTIFEKQVTVHTYGSFVPAPTGQGVLMTENSSVVRQLIRLKEVIDVRPQELKSELIKLVHANAEEVAAMINKLLDSRKDVPVPGGAPNGNLPLMNDRTLISGTADVLPDTRSNQILIVTRPINLPFLENLISQLDKPADFIVPHIRKLKYVMASDILPALEETLAQGKTEQDQASKDELLATAANKEANNAQANNAGTAQANNGNSGNGTTGGGSSGVSSVTPKLETPHEKNIPKVVNVGNVRILADNRSNSIIVFGPPDAADSALAIIDHLDRRPLQVYLSTVIGQLTVGKNSEFGIDILQKFQKIGQGGLANGQIVGSGTTSSSQVPDPRSLVSSAGFLLNPGLTLYGAIGSTLDAYVRALAETNHFKVIGRPSVCTSNNKLAVIASGSSIPIPANTTSGFTGSNSSLTTNSSISYEQVLLELDIVPMINADKQITLKIRQTNNSLGKSTIISGNSIPSINTQEINTEITVPNRATVVIGGLVSDTNTTNTTGVPYLSDIPGIGNLFKDTVKANEHDELLIMIQPNVLESEEDEINNSVEENHRTALLGMPIVRAALPVNSPVVDSSPAFKNTPPDLLPGQPVAPSKHTTTKVSSPH